MTELSRVGNAGLDRTNEVACRRVEPWSQVAFAVRIGNWGLRTGIRANACLHRVPAINMMLII